MQAKWTLCEKNNQKEQKQVFDQTQSNQVTSKDKFGHLI
jgi:hypothetical protein